jgi:isopropylmalate/homocitrate/citramalate synthase
MVGLLKTIAGTAEVGIHVHNNFGLATACSLAGVEAGANNVETSVNGIADGAGLAAFEEVVMALTVMYGIDLGIKIEKLMDLSNMVQEITGISVPTHKPIVGKNIFIETPDTHIENILRNRLSKKKTNYYINPEAIGQKSQLLFGPSALGGESIRLKAKEMGIELRKNQISSVISQMRDRFRVLKNISEKDIEEIIRKIA